MATAPIRPLGWEPPHAMGAALEKTDQKKKKEFGLDCFIIKLFTYEIVDKIPMS